MSEKSYCEGFLTEEQIGEARRQAVNSPMSYHADSCPYLFNGRRPCECNVYSAELRWLPGASHIARRDSR